MRVDNSLLAGIAASSSAAKSTAKSHKTAESTTFSSALKSATTTKKTDSDSTTTSDASKKTSAAETTKAVDGHPYADIITGPRAGLYVNTSGNSRNGEAFVMVKRNGREYHIYGTGKDREVIGLKTAAEKASTPGTDSASTTDATSGTTDAGKITTDASTQ